MPLTSPKAPRTRQAAPDEDADTLVARYEQLRAVVLDGHPGGVGLGLGVLVGRGLAAWIAVWRSAPPPACPIPAASTLRSPAGSTGAASSDLVNVLVAMALAHL